MCPERNVDYLMPEAFIYSAATTPWSALRRDRTSGDGAKSSRPGRAWTQTILCPNPSVWREPLGPQTPVQPGLHCRPPFVFFRVTKQLLVKQRKTKTPRTTPEIIHLRSSSFTPRKLGFTLNKGKPPPPGPVFSPTPFIKITQGQRAKGRRASQRLNSGLCLVAFPVTDQADAISVITRENLLAVTTCLI
uniref:Deoxycytidylate deaminase isoform X1 n=1 Tax=Camelus bactrianus TaxID=9837 RepID=A0A9W3G313_CAMBA|nr:deoxycytidylate deaminase isoform X1 [Camelus bactrianus]